MRAAGASLCVCVIAALPALVDAAFPEHTGYVNDFSHLLSDSARGELEQLLRATEKETTAEIVVATVPSLDGMPVEEYANRLFKEWGIGKEQIDNGVLVLIAPNEREVRIEVGYGLEPVLPDGLAGEIIRTVFLPRFREDDYPRGIQEGVARVVDVVKKKHVLTPEELRSLDEGDRPPTWLTTPFFGLFVAIGFFMVGAGLGSRTGFPLLFGSFFGGMPFLMSLIPFFNASLVVLAPLAAGMAYMGFRSGRRGGAWIQQMRSTPRAARSNAGGSSAASDSGWVMGGSKDSSSSDSGSSSGSSGSSGGSSGGSFGGGSSGGGGASGRW